MDWSRVPRSYAKLYKRVGPPAIYMSVTYTSISATNTPRIDKAIFILMYLASNVMTEITLESLEELLPHALEEDEPDARWTLIQAMQVFIRRALALVSLITPFLVV